MCYQPGAEHLSRQFFCFLWCIGYLYASSFASTTGIYLGFDGHFAAKLASYLLGFSRCGSYSSFRHGDTELGQQRFCLVFMDFHPFPSFYT